MIDFNIKPYDIQGNLIYNQLIGTWVKVSPELVDLLRERQDTLDHLKEILMRRESQHVQGFTFSFLNDVDLHTYASLLLLLSAITNALSEYANEFCIAYRGYSLN